MEWTEPHGTDTLPQEPRGNMTSLRPDTSSTCRTFLQHWAAHSYRAADEFDTKRKQHAAFYNRAFADTDFVELPPDSEGNSWHLYLMRLNSEKLDCDRNTFAKELQHSGIGISVHFIPLFQFTYWKNLYKDFTAENYPNAMKAYSRTITLPLWPDMTQQMLERVVQCVKETGERHHA